MPPSVAHEGNPREYSLDVPSVVNPVLEPTIPQGGGATPITNFAISASSNFDCTHGVTSVTITVNGGVAPYTVLTTLGDITQLTANTYTLSAPANSGSGISGNAYCMDSPYCGPLCVVNCVARNFGCNDQSLSECQDGGCGCSPGHCYGIQDLKYGCNSAQCSDCGGHAGTGCPTAPGPSCDGGASGCDTRSGAMISGGCNPCGISTRGGAIVTATDSTGKSVFVAVTQGNNVVD